MSLVDLLPEELRGLPSPWLSRPPHALEVLALVQAWIYSVSAGIARTVLMWLTTHAMQIPRPQRMRMVAIADDLWPALEEDIASSLLTTASGVARDDALDLLAAVERRAGTQVLREIATRYREWTASRTDRG